MHVLNTINGQKKIKYWGRIQGKQPHYEKNANKKRYLGGIWDFDAVFGAILVTFSEFQNLNTLSIS